jgi:hypothetical protein
MNPRSIIVVAPKLSAHDRHPSVFVGRCDDPACHHPVALQPMPQLYPNMKRVKVRIFCLECFVDRCKYPHETGVVWTKSRLVLKTKSMGITEFKYPGRRKVRVLVINNHNAMYIYGNEYSTLSVTRRRPA